MKINLPIYGTLSNTIQISILKFQLTNSSFFVKTEPKELERTSGKKNLVIQKFILFVFHVDLQLESKYLVLNSTTQIGILYLPRLYPSKRCYFVHCGDRQLRQVCSSTQQQEEPIRQRDTTQCSNGRAITLLLLKHARNIISGLVLMVYRLFFLRSIAQFFTQIYMNCFVSS